MTPERPHLRLRAAASYHYRKLGRGPTYQHPPRDRTLHAQRLRDELAESRRTAEERGFHPNDPLPLTYELVPQALELVESLERSASGITLLAVVQGPNDLRATIRVPKIKQRILDGILKRYAVEDHSRSHRPKGEDLVTSIESIRLATELDLWTDSVPFPPSNEELWWEVWLHDPSSDRASHEQTKAEFAERAAEVGITVGQRFFHFPDRTVVVAHGAYEQWVRAPRLILEVAELRRAKATLSQLAERPPVQQKKVVEQVLARILVPPIDAPRVCLLDQGVDKNHPLLRPAMSGADAQALDPAWGTEPHDAQHHGTQMAGMALLGPLEDVLSTHGQIELEHRLESVKILPPRGENPPEVYGAVTAEAIARAEVQAPNVRRVACLMTTASARDGGLPSSWSGAIDQVTAPDDDGDTRLVVVAAGNLRDEILSPDFRYPVIQGPIAGVEDPAQSWNAITVGAVTDRVVIQDQDFADHEPIAPRGGLSPTSRTSLAWPEEARDDWPYKPDLVMEGGNWARSPRGKTTNIDDLGLLTTTSKRGALLTTTFDTSAATAGAARFAARLWARYPNLRAETVRALMIHSARWSKAAEEMFPGRSQEQAVRRLRCFGYGSPDFNRAVENTTQAATLLYEGAIQPYRAQGSAARSNEMHVHSLPWPREVLQALGAEPITLRVTLSYFVEPSPGRRGWNQRYRYASHGLRFDVKRPTESRRAFVKRVSEAAIDEEDQEDPEARAAGMKWAIGARARVRGSVHSDWLTATAAQFAEMDQIAVFPVTGWWKERPALGRAESPAPYSLVVSVESAAAGIDLYAEIEAIQVVEVGT